MWLECLRVTQAKCHEQSFQCKAVWICRSLIYVLRSYFRSQAVIAQGWCYGQHATEHPLFAFICFVKACLGIHEDQIEVGLTCLTPLSDAARAAALKDTYEHLRNGFSLIHFFGVNMD